MRDKRSGEVVAIKAIPRANIDRFVIEEVQNLSKCHHPQIIQFREVGVDFFSSVGSADHSAYLFEGIRHRNRFWTLNHAEGKGVCRPMSLTSTWPL